MENVTFNSRNSLKSLTLYDPNPLLIVAKERDLADQIFSIRNFIRTLSYREFVTSLSLALLLLAVYSLLDYYSNEDWIENNESVIKWTLFCLLLPINHIFYKVEHKRPNNFIGRNFHDYIFLLLFILLYKLRLLLYGSSLSLGIEGIGGVIVFLLVFIITVMLFELAVAILKRGLTLLRWQIL
jgi:hypothetical protein